MQERRPLPSMCLASRRATVAVACWNVTDREQAVPHGRLGQRCSRYCRVMAPEAVLSAAAAAAAAQAVRIALERIGGGKSLSPDASERVERALMTHMTFAASWS